MGVCIKLATRSLRKNKGRTLITLMGIVLSVLMVCTIFTLLNSMLDSAIDSIIEKDGNWHIAVYNTTAEQIADLEAAEGVLSTQMISIDENDVFRITLKNPDEVYEFASRYLSETTEYSYHTELLSYLGISQSESIKSLIMGIAAALLLIIAVGAISLIYNAFAISVSERTKELGLLSSIGATQKDIRTIVYSEALLLGTVAIPIGIVLGLLTSWALNMEIKNIRLNIVDNDHSAVSQRLVNKIAASTYFHLTEVPASYEEGLRNIELGTADIVMEIPRHLERDWMNGRDAHILVAANSVNGTKGGLGSSYLTAIINGYASELRSERPEAVSVSGIIPSIRIDTQGLFNPNLNYKLYMIPALMAMLLTLICGFLPALNVVSEKEVGTIEQINVTPVPKFTFILAKLLPYWIVGFIVLTLCFVLAWLLYGIVPVGHFSMIYLLVIFFVLVMSGFGLVISNYSATMQQSMFVMFFFMLILMLMSGLFTPVSSMPEWTQAITVFNPLKYFIEAMRMVYLKGSGLVDLLPEIGILSLFAVFFNSWAVISYRKSR